MSAFHPRQDEDGAPLALHSPTRPTPQACWPDPRRLATAIPQGTPPPALNGVAFEIWRDAPGDDAGWAALAGAQAPFDEPPFVAAPGKRVAAGVVIGEDDGRVWVVHPSNGFGGYLATFPKGTLDPGGTSSPRLEPAALRAAALREAYEESGLRVSLSGFLMDLTRSRSRTRYYLGRRVGGCPSDMGWESQAVSLVPRARLGEVLLNPNDAPLLAWLLA